MTPQSNKTSSWFSISVTVAPEASEAIEYAFNSLDSLGTEINHLQKKNSESVTVVGYFDEMPDEERVQDELHYALRIHHFDEDAIQKLERSKIEDADWLSEWKKHWKPTTVGNFVVAPPWSEVDEPDKILIRIEPNMAFGTGTHETTQLCLRAIEKLYQPGDSFFDVGTGTGILAIAAAKLNIRAEVGNTQINACDTDAESVLLAIENAELNGTMWHVAFSVGSITEDSPASDFVCANLTLDAIEPNLTLLLNKAGRTLVLSGILLTQQPQIVAQLSQLGYNEPEIASAGEWISVVVKKDS